MFFLEEYAMQLRDQLLAMQRTGSRPDMQDAQHLEEEGMEQTEEAEEQEENDQRAR
ncbi:MAG: hypothetical protein RMJ43_14575 [Chloroherpetonaceae bacterium]|nr:hypothetical protein [Chthonomonadaceae bacterium]MDW8209057.1 hypothetical protein [Chloroherpetonaceae bacterium]